MATYELMMQKRDGSAYPLYYDTRANALYPNRDKADPLPCPVTQNKTQGHEGVSLRVSLGKKCNFSCKYCMQPNPGSGGCSEASPSAAHLRDTVDNVIAFLGKKKLAVVQFWGGEPLVYFDAIQQLHSLFQQADVSTKYAICTNGELLHGERAEWILKNSIQITLSWDGKSQHVRGKDPLDNLEVLETIRALHGLQLNPVLCRESGDLLEYNLDAQKRLGTSEYSLGEACPVMCVDQSSFTYRIPERDLPEMSRKHYMGLLSGALGNWGVAHQAVGQWLMHYGEELSVRSKCFVSSQETLTVDLHGNILTCQNFDRNSPPEIGASGEMESHVLGHVGTTAPGPFPKPPLSKLAARWNRKCRDCLVLGMCRGMCPFTVEEYEEYNCMASYYYNLPFFGFALHHMTGDCLLNVQEVSHA